jgi:imidazole glycerol-phosphate synthase subunit HisH
MKVGVIDYGVGNLGSVIRALDELRVTPFLITRALDMSAMDCLILPGVGNFADCAKLLEKGGWSEALKDQVQEFRKPLLGVCVGMQLLASFSMEGVESNAPNGIAGLDLIPGRVEHLSMLGCTLRVPHVGWNAVSPVSSHGGLFDGIPEGTDLYFVHSYAFVAEEPADVIATTEYGIPITAAVRRGNVWGTQFHPEKSSRAGFRLLRNFIDGPKC